MICNPGCRVLLFRNNLSEAPIAFSHRRPALDCVMDLEMASGFYESGLQSTGPGLLAVVMLFLNP